MSAQQAISETGTLMPWSTTIGEVLDRITSGDPDKTFVEISGASYSYREVRDGVLRTAAMFREMGARHGDRVCLFMPNAIEYLYCWFGLSELGAISVPINTAYRCDEPDAAPVRLIARQVRPRPVPNWPSSPPTAITASSPTAMVRCSNWRPTIAATPRSRMRYATSSTASD